MARAHVPPFPYAGGKGRIAEHIWRKFGKPDLYIEPFAGSLAVLLACPSPATREVVCDLDGLICNFWRALQADPEAVANHADYPTIHQDLTARHRYLVRWARDNADRLSEDPRYYDAEAAGWWVWGISIWIGSGWCIRNSPGDTRPHVERKPTGGVGVAKQRLSVPDKRPYVSDRVSGGRGSSAQRRDVGDIRPHVGSGARLTSGRGVSKQRLSVPDKRPITSGGSGVLSGAAASPQRRNIPTGRLDSWFAALADRLENVIVLNRDWRSAVTPSVLADTPTGPGERANRCILLDPPYVTGNRSELYGSDVDGSSDQTAADSYEWAVEHGERYRIAYCCHEGDFEVPAGWTTDVRGFAGHRIGRADKTKDLVMFSPKCDSGPRGLLDL